MNHKKLAGATAALFFGTAAMTQAANAGMDTVLTDGGASFSISHSACTSDKHLFSFSIGADFSNRSGADANAAEASLAAVAESYNNGLGKTLDEVITLTVGSHSVAELKMAAVGGVMSGRVHASPEVAKKIEDLRPAFDKGSAEMGEKLDAMAQTVALEDPYGFAVKVSLTPAPSPQCN